MPDDVDRRPIAVRTAWWAKSAALGLTRIGLKPNHVSLLSVVFAATGGLLFFLTPQVTTPTSIIYLLGAAACIQLRLLCNMLDGMMAVEGGMQSKLGAIFNEFPDRVADIFFLLAAGYACNMGEIGIQLGWANSVFAVLTAYIRSFGASMGIKQDFCGPMAKPHRMFVLTVAAVIASIEIALNLPARVLFIAMIVIGIGSIATCVRRTARLVKALESR